MIRHASLLGLVFCALAAAQDRLPKDRLPNTEPWELNGDPADFMISGIDQFLLDQTKLVSTERQQRLQSVLRDQPTVADQENVLRARLRKCLGIRDPLVSAPRLMHVAPVATKHPAADPEQTIERFWVRWEVVPNVWAEGLLVQPSNVKITTQMVLLPDADQAPESLASTPADPLLAGPIALQLASTGVRVVIPCAISRTVRKFGNAELTDREYIYRAAFGLGRHVQGYEVATALTCRQALQSLEDLPVWCAGYGEGGRIALAAAAFEPLFAGAAVSGSFGPREALWQEPIDRNQFGSLLDFGDAELAALIAPRPLLVEPSAIREVKITGKGAGPGSLSTLPLASVTEEFNRYAKVIAKWKKTPSLQLLVSDDGQGKAFQAGTLAALIVSANLSAPAKTSYEAYAVAPIARPELPEQIMRAWDRHTQAVLEESPYVRAEYMKEIDFSSLDTYQTSIEKYRERFSSEVIGRFDLPLLPPRPRSKVAYDQPKWVGYEVMLDVWDHTCAYGILLLPRDLKPNEKRPVVVCQHGLEGRPQDIVTGDHPAYHDFAAKLAEQGYIVFAPQNPYLFHDRFRTLQRKANPLGKSLFSIIAPQHRQIIRWLSTLPNVDPHRIAFYGLSYGGKSAMRIPALVPEYCLSICSADFNDWVWKLSSTRSNYSYVRTPEYEIFEFDLGSTFNYSEMAHLIAPRPFMVERGHFDGVAPDERVALEYAKVRFLYAAKLRLADRTEIEWFVGPHTINGQGTFAFLKKHLQP